MDPGLAILISGVMTPLTVLAAGLWNRYEIRQVAKQAALEKAQIAHQLERHNSEVSYELAKNTEITKQTMAKVEETANSVNGILAARILAEKEASRLEGQSTEKARADAEKKG